MYIFETVCQASITIPFLEMDYQKIIKENALARLQHLNSPLRTLIYHNPENITVAEIEGDLNCYFREIVPTCVNASFTNSGTTPATLQEIMYFGKNVPQEVTIQGKACVAYLAPGESKDVSMLLEWNEEQSNYFANGVKFGNQLTNGYLNTYAKVRDSKTGQITYVVPENLSTAYAMKGPTSHLRNAIHHIAVGDGVSPSFVANNYGPPTSVVNVSQETFQQFRNIADARDKFYKNGITIKKIGDIEVRLTVVPGKKITPQTNFNINLADDEKMEDEIEIEVACLLKQSRTVQYERGEEEGTLNFTKGGALPTSLRKWKQLLKISGLFKFLSSQNADSNDFCKVLQDTSCKDPLVKVLIHFFHLVLEYYAKRAVDTHADNDGKHHKEMIIPEDHLWEILKTCPDGNALCKIVNLIDTYLRIIATSVWQSTHPLDFGLKVKFADESYKPMVIEELAQWINAYTNNDFTNVSGDGDPMKFLEHEFFGKDFHIENGELHDTKMGYSRRLNTSKKYLNKNPTYGLHASTFDQLAEGSSDDGMIENISNLNLSGDHGSDY